MIFLNFNEINIQETQKRYLIIYEFENKAKFIEILISIIFRDINNDISKKDLK